MCLSACSSALAYLNSLSCKCPPCVSSAANWATRSGKAIIQKMVNIAKSVFSKLNQYYPDQMRFSLSFKSFGVCCLAIASGVLTYKFFKSNPTSQSAEGDAGAVTNVVGDAAAARS